MTVSKFRAKGDLSKIARSDAVADQLEAIAEPVWDALKRDPNPFFRSSLRKRRFRTSGRRGRVSIQMGAAPLVGLRVEAARGTFARALGRIL